MLSDPRAALGVDAGGIPQTEADHFITCPGCAKWFDMRALAQVLAHAPDGNIEISEGPEPPQSARIPLLVNKHAR